MGPADVVNSARPYKWRFVGGQLCLDFANTAGSRRLVPGSRVTTRLPRDRLGDYRKLLDWAKVAGVIGHRSAQRLARLASSQPRTAVDTWQRAVGLREAIYRLGACAIEHIAARAKDLKVVNSELHSALSHLRIVPRRNRLVVQWVGQDRHLDGPLWPLALSAVDFFIQGPGGRLKRCPGVACGWLFVDATKNGRRVWCSMSDCGNRSKVKRYRNRRRGAAAVGERSLPRAPRGS